MQSNTADMSRRPSRVIINCQLLSVCEKEPLVSIAVPLSDGIVRLTVGFLGVCAQTNRQSAVEPLPSQLSLI